MLAFVGLGLYDEQSITVEGRRIVGEADSVFAERYTSHLARASLADLEAFHDVAIEVRDRAGIERDPAAVLSAAESGLAVLLVGGDPMVSTTHVDLRLRAHDRGIETRIVHGTSVATAIPGLTGLQNYRFGPATTLPFADSHGGAGVPDSVLATLADNRARGLHTLMYLDIIAEDERFMTADHAATLLHEAWRESPWDRDAGVNAGGDVDRTPGDAGPLAVAVARAGSTDPLVVADDLAGLARQTFGDPLHALVVPGRLHHIERTALVEFADAPLSVER